MKMYPSLKKRYSYECPFMMILDAFVCFWNITWYVCIKNREIPA